MLGEGGCTCTCLIGERGRTLNRKFMQFLFYPHCESQPLCLRFRPLLAYLKGVSSDGDNSGFLGLFLADFLGLKGLYIFSSKLYHTFHYTLHLFYKKF